MRPKSVHGRLGTCRIVGVVAACLSAAPAVMAQPDVLDQALALQRRLQYTEATRLLAEALPDLSGEQRARAALLLAALSTDHKEARRFLREVQQAAPGSDLQRRAEIELARLDFARGNYNSVRSRLEPYADPEARLLVASSWVALDDAAQAETVLRELPSSPRTQLLQCWVARRRGDHAAALAALTTLAAAGGDFQPTVLLWKSECEIALGRSQEAMSTAAELQRRYPDSPEIALLEPRLPALRQAPPATGMTPAPAPATILLQLGVFETRANALRLRDKIPGTLGTARIDEVQRGSQRLFRVSLGPFENAAVATEFARTRLAPAGFEWRLVAPESP